jgi:hypothetical protein
LRSIIPRTDSGSARSRSGIFSPSVQVSGGNLSVIQRNATGIVRVRYFDIQADRFLWRADHGSDNGKTWVRDFWMMEANRIGK